MRVMRCFIVSLLLFGHAIYISTPARSEPFLRTVASHVVMPASALVNYKLRCPAGYVPIAYAFTPQYEFDENTEMSRDLIDRNQVAINRTSLSSATALDGGGYAVSLQNEEHHQHDFQAKVSCLTPSAATDNRLVLVRSTAATPKQTTGTVTLFCPPESPVALAGFSNADGRMLLQEVGSAPVWGTSASPTFLGELQDGQAGPPVGWQVKVFNGNFAATMDVVGFGVCANAPSLQAFIYSVVAPQQGAFGYRPAFSLFAPVPDGWSAVGSGFEGGPYARFLTMDLWMQDGVVVDMLQWYPESTAYDSGAAEVRAFIARGNGNAPAASSARAVFAVLALPQAAAPPANVGIVEFYNAQLDHYFITAIPTEIAKLDDGTFSGWARTGESFKAYGIGSTGRTGRRPVCRAYGLPEAGLNSHFYSASPDECMATLANRFSWGLEASEVFQMDLPDPVTGACPAGGVPVYRVWNSRSDSNHRYTSSIAVRDQMVAKGYIAEGYGPNAVALCALP